MDGGLSQDEINALLSGMSLSDDEPGMLRTVRESGRRRKIMCFRIWIRMP